ncbi:MAG: VCBS repeat-containing protein, partial [Planctomycetaceae bacterium]|nr:VCBS repeat-containing protein [Planctomycetaceae bacterium]
MIIDWLKSLRTPRSRRKASEISLPTPLESRTLLSAIPVGPEFQVNSFTSNVQARPSIAMDADGDYVVIWQSGKFIGSGQDGSGYGIYAQRYNAEGQAQGSEFQINMWTTLSQEFSSIAMDADGDFVITWQSDKQDGSSNGIYARRYNALGVAQGNEFQVNSFTTGAQRYPSIGMDADGDFVITWQSVGQDGSGYGIYAQRYNAAGEPQGIEFQVNSLTNYWQTIPSIGMDSDGDFVITWQSDRQDGSDNGIYAQRYNAAGVPQGTEFQVNSFTTGAQSQPSIGMDADGDFVITWQSKEQDGSNYGIYAQRYNAAGTPQGTEFQVNSFTNHWQTIPSIAMDPDGDFIITWQSNALDGSDYEIYSQRYNALGMKQGTEFLVNSYSTGIQRRPSIAMVADGDFVIAWQSYDQDGSEYGVYAQRFRASHSDNLAVWRSSRFYLDSNRSDTWNGATDDTLNTFGSTTDKPLAGDWNGDGYSDIGIWRNGTFYLDANGNGTWDGPATDKQFVFGNSTDTPIVGDWNNDGIDDIGI